MTPRVHAFFEGPTEKKVLSHLSKLTNIGFYYNGQNSSVEDSLMVTGKADLVRKIRDIVTPLLEADEPVRALIFRDVDSGEKFDSVMSGLMTNLSGLFQGLKFDDGPRTHGIAIGNAKNFRIALHIADHSCFPGCTKTTMDDYILELALLEDTARKLLLPKHQHVATSRLLAKIRVEIPQLLVANGFHLTEAKDYARLYAAVVQMATSPPVFAEKVLANCEQQSVLTQFAALLAAIKALEP